MARRSGSSSSEPGTNVAPGTDVDAILDGTVTVTPLHNDLTFHAKLDAATRVLGEGTHCSTAR